MSAPRFGHGQKYRLKSCGKLHAWCNVCKNMSYRTKEQAAEYRRTWNAKLRSDVLGAYGNKCACCGEAEPKFLSIDHINGDGAAHRREVGVGSGFHFYLWIRRNEYPTGFQLLCHNCNSAKGSYGRCPHEEAL